MINIYRCSLVKEGAIYASVKDTDQAGRLFMDLIGDASEEYFYMAALNAAGDVVGVHEVAHGALTLCPVHPREVFKRALANNANSIIIAHNHPTGSADPSPEDIETTKRLIECGRILGIPVVDHIIIGDRPRSMRQCGDCEF